MKYRTPRIDLLVNTSGIYARQFSLEKMRFSIVVVANVRRRFASVLQCALFAAILTWTFFAPVLEWAYLLRSRFNFFIPVHIGPVLCYTRFGSRPRFGPFAAQLYLVPMLLFEMGPSKNCSTVVVAIHA